MIRKTRGASVATVVAMAIMLILSLSVITNPLLSVMTANAETSGVDTSTVSESNTTAVQNPLGDAVLTLDDGTNVLDAEPASGLPPGSSNGATDSDLPSDSSSTTTSSDLGGDATTGEVEPSGDPATGEVGSTTGEVGSTTGEVEPSGDPATGEVEPSGDPATGEVEPSGDPATGEVEPSGDPATGEVGPSGDPATGEVGPSGDPATGEVGTTANSSVTDDVTTGVNISGTDSSASTLSAELAGASGGAELGVSDQFSSSRTNTIDDNSLSSVSSSDSATISSAENPNAVVQPISADGTPQAVSLGDASDADGTSAHISLDKESYAPGDTAVVTVQDPDADVDSNIVNTVQLVIGSSIDDPNGSTVTLTETAPDSGVFVGTTEVPASGSEFRLNYDASHPQAQAVISDVTQGGSVEVTELPVSSFEEVLGIGNGQPATLVGNGIQLTLLEGADLALSNDCEAIGFQSGMGCGGSTSITISYANAPADLNGLPPGGLTIWQFVPGAGWQNLVDFQGLADIIIDENTKTVSAISPFGSGVYVIGENTDAGGGGGGSGGFPGAGIVLDLIAPIVDSSSEVPTTSPQPVSESTTSLSALDVVDDVGDDDTTSGAVGSDSNANVSAKVESVKSGVGVGDTSAISRNGNTTIVVPGEGNVTLSFTNLISEGALTVNTLEDSDLPKFSITKDTSQGGIIKTLDNIPYSLAGSVFRIGPDDAQFNGTITVSVPLKASLLPQGSDVRLLHYTGSGWEDVTTQADANTVSGSLDSLGAVAPAVRSQSISLVSASQ